MKCPVCRQIFKPERNNHTCPTPRRRCRTFKADRLYRWAKAYNDSEGHPSIGGPEDR